MVGGSVSRGALTYERTVARTLYLEMAAFWQIMRNMNLDKLTSRTMNTIIAYLRAEF